MAALFGFALWLLFVLIISAKLRHIAYNDSFIRIKNYGLWMQLAASDYISLDASLPGLYQLRTSTGKYLFLAGYFGSLGTLLQQSSEPTAITNARRVLANEKS